MFLGFESKLIHANGIDIHCRVGGECDALLLLHGHPQTHATWHRVAEQYAQKYTVVAADLRGYGDSDKPSRSEFSKKYSKRVMAQDQVALMQNLGFHDFSVIAHDRGARVAHRMAVDFPETLKKLVLLDIAPTLAMYENTNEAFARAYWHWFFLIQPAPFPESLIEANPERYLHAVMAGRSAGMAPFTEEAVAEYLRCLSLPGAATGICEDYRASAGIDLEDDRHDIAHGRGIHCPLLVLWGADGVVGRCYDPLKEWRRLADDVTGEALPCGHYIPEEMPDLLLDQTIAFLES